MLGFGGACRQTQTDYSGKGAARQTLLNNCDWNCKFTVIIPPNVFSTFNSLSKLSNDSNIHITPETERYAVSNLEHMRASILIPAVHQS